MIQLWWGGLFIVLVFDYEFSGWMCLSMLLRAVVKHCWTGNVVLRLRTSNIVV